MEKKLGSEVSEDLVLLAINQLADKVLLTRRETKPDKFDGLSCVVKLVTNNIDFD